LPSGPRRRFAYRSRASGRVAAQGIRGADRRQRRKGARARGPAVTEGDAQELALRRPMSARREALSARGISDRSAADRARLTDWTARLPATADGVAVYAAIRNEVDLSALARALREHGTLVAYPRVCPPARLTFHRVEDATTLVPTGRYGIPEPPPEAPEVN